MASLSPTVSQPKAIDGRGNGPNDRVPGGGGGGGRGDDSPNYGERMRRYRLAMAVGLVSVFMLFFTFSFVFVIRQKVGSWSVATQSYVHDWKSVPLPTTLLLVNTFVILLSSFTLHKARRLAFEHALVAAAGIPGIKIHHERAIPWLGITIALGLAFLGGQYLAWRQIMHRGFYMSANPNSSFFYVLTGMHAVHLIAGLLALLYAGIVVRWHARNWERLRVILDVNSWYWHSMAALWLFIFALLKLVE